MQGNEGCTSSSSDQICFQSACLEAACKSCDGSIATSVNADAVLVHVSSVGLHLCNWNKPQGEFVVHCQNQANEFNEICPEAKISDTQAIRMLQNLLSSAPNLVLGVS